MPQDVTGGTVQYYNPQKMYGFLDSDAGEKVFFHASARGGARIWTFRTPRFSQRIELAFISDSIDVPQKGDRIRFILSATLKGLQATPWTFERNWIEAQASVITPVYRLMRQRDVVRKGRLCRDELIEFEGSVEDLEAKFPKLYHQPDPLAPLETPLVKSRFYFLVDLGDGWEECADPRELNFSSRPALSSR